MIPEIVIAGGCVLLFGLVCIALWINRRRRTRESPRNTCFHLTVIDPRVARLRRAAWERSTAPADEIEIPIDVEEVATDRTVAGYDAYAAALTPRAPLPTGYKRTRIARGSASAIVTPIRPCPVDWEVGSPSVTARQRAIKRT